MVNFKSTCVPVLNLVHVVLKLPLLNYLVQLYYLGTTRYVNQPGNFTKKNLFVCAERGSDRGKLSRNRQG